MKTNKIALASSLLVLALGGCAMHRDHHGGPHGPGGPGTKHRMGPPTTCNGASCQVRVTVDANCVITAGDVKIDTDTPVVNIAWHLTGGEFTRDGIFIKSGPPGHFGAGNPAGPVFTHVFRNNPRKQKWEFGVKVKVGERTCDPFDPFIMN